MYPACDLGFARIPTFGLALAIGLAITLWLLRSQSKRSNIPFDVLHVATLWAFLGGAVGCRLLHVLVVDRTLDLSDLSRLSGGTLYFGFLIGAAVGSFGYLKVRCLSVYPVLDVCIPAWLAMQVAGRIGCFLAGCCFGTPTQLPWGVASHSTLAHASSGVHLHPTQLYEAFGLLVLLPVLLKRHRAWRDGMTTWSYLLYYCVLRFGIEFLRGDYRGELLGGLLSTSQTIAIVITLVVFCLILRNRRSARQDPSPFECIGTESP